MSLRCRVAWKTCTGMRAREIKAELMDSGVDTSDIFDKDDLAKRAWVEGLGLRVFAVGLEFARSVSHRKFALSSYSTVLVTDDGDFSRIHFIIHDGFPKRLCAIRGS